MVYILIWSKTMAVHDISNRKHDKEVLGHVTGSLITGRKEAQVDVGHLVVSSFLLMALFV